jgi:hypothetical protein
MTENKTTPVNQSSKYKMENISHWIKIGYLLEPSKRSVGYKDMMTHGNFTGQSEDIRYCSSPRNNVNRIENHQLGINERMVIP